MVPAKDMLHSRFNRIMAILVWAIAALVAGLGLWGSEPELAWIYPAAALAAFLAWAALWRPGVAVSATGVHVRNVTHSVDIPWEALVHIETRRALTLITPRARFVVWSAPAPSMMTTQIIGRRPLNREAKAVGGAPRPSDLLGSDSGDAAALVREEWQRRLDGGLVAVGVADEFTVTRRWDTTVIVIGVLLTTVTLGMLVITG